MVKKNSFLGEVFKPFIGFTKIKLTRFSGDWSIRSSQSKKKDDRVAKDKEGNLYTWASFRALWEKK